MSSYSSCTGSPYPFLCIILSNTILKDPSTIDPIFIYFTLYTLFIVSISVFLSIIQFIAKCCKLIRYVLGISYLLFCVIVAIRTLYLVIYFFCKDEVTE
jgi:hypothetical protein